MSINSALSFSLASRMSRGKATPFRLNNGAAVAITAFFILSSVNRFSEPQSSQNWNENPIKVVFFSRASAKELMEAL